MVTPSMHGESPSVINDTRKGLQMRVYPNPASGAFYLEFLNGLEKGVKQVDIYAISGTIVQSVQLNGQKKQMFSGSELKPGIYYIRSTSGDRVETLKLVKL